ncbi:retrovirus-related pol polyprotein from transposon TNT 1-94 [Tanacetum coccineum]
MISTSGEVRARTLFVLSSSNRGRLLGFIDLMRQKNKRMKQEGLIKHYGILQKMEDSTRYDKEGNKINIEDLLKKIKTKLMLIEDKLQLGDYSNRRLKRLKLMLIDKFPNSNRFPFDRTKKPKVVPISTRKPKSQVNKSIATHPKKTVALESTVQNSKSYYRMLYEKTSKAWKWWIEQQCPLGYKWVPKTKMKWVPKVRNETGLITSKCLNHNLFSGCQFCERIGVLFESTCSFRDLQGNDLLTGNRGSDLYTNSLQETTTPTPICLMAKASPTQTWLWHRRLSYLNFDYINLLSKKDVVIGLPKLKYVKDQLCSSCEVSKAKRSSFKTKAVPNDYSKYTWTLFLRSKDETPKVLKDFLTMIQRNLQAPVISVQTDRGTEFLNKTLNAFFKEEGIEH